MYCLKYTVTLVELNWERLLFTELSMVKKKKVKIVNLDLRRVNLGVVKTSGGPLTIAGVINLPSSLTVDIAFRSENHYILMEDFQNINMNSCSAHLLTLNLDSDASFCHENFRRKDENYKKHF